MFFGFLKSGCFGYWEKRAKKMGADNQVVMYGGILDVFGNGRLVCGNGVGE
jgi:hypothetical protein